MDAWFDFRNIILSSKFFFLIIFSLQIHHNISADSDFYMYKCNNVIGNYTENNFFKSNLNTILSSITMKTNTFGFYNNTAGHGADQVNALAYCRGDIDIESCRDCLEYSAGNLTKNSCPVQMEAIIWEDECVFRYSNNQILGVMSTNPGVTYINPYNNVSNIDSFSQELHSFALGDLLKQAYNGNFHKYAGIKLTDPKGQTIFGLMQCSPDITHDDCMSCLQYCENYLSPYYYSNGGRLYTPSCIFHYELYPFLETFTNPPPPPSPPSPPSSTPPLHLPPTRKVAGTSKTIIIVVGAIEALLFLTLILAIVFFTQRRWKNAGGGQTLKDKEEELDGIGDGETRQYDFALIRAATNDFSVANLLGRGKFGEVFKGILSNRKEIAVKKLSTTSAQGENEFINEVILLAKLQHKCLVRLLGFCIEQKDRLLLYEYMENGSLDNALFDGGNRPRLDWGMRYKIINSVAKGLLYLHEGSRVMIIHRDIKASNILLDREMNAKISDYGTTRLFVSDESVANTRSIDGTMGYMAPEYAIHGQFSVKSDVYSFGILLLEILSGKRNNYSLTDDSSGGLLRYAFKAWKDGRALDLMDPVLIGHTYSPEIIIRCVQIALLCTQDDVGSRPTMATVDLMLQSLTMTVPLPSEPGLLNNNRHWISEVHESTSSGSRSNFENQRLRVVNQNQNENQSMHMVAITAVD